MKTAVSGATGFIGTSLCRYLKGRGHTIVPLDREILSPLRRNELQQVIGRCDAVVNLAGAPIDRRWTPAYLRQMYDSRLFTTRLLAGTIAASKTPPRVFISASAVGYFPGEGCHDESSTAQGNGILADLCRKWEAASQDIPKGVRRCITRFGVVLDGRSGAFPKMATPVKKGIAVIVGSGQQPFSWIDLHDLTRAIEFVMENDPLEGPIHFTAPQRISQSEFTRILAEHYGSRITVRIPSFLLRLAMGSGAQIVTQGQCVIPGKLLEEGFVFSSPTLQDFFHRI